MPSKTTKKGAWGRGVIAYVRLSEAAPDLLAALKNLLSVYRANYNEGDTTPAIRMAEAAIAKAEGRTA